MYAWYRVGGFARQEAVDELQHSSFWPAAGRELLSRFAPAVEPKPKADWLADFRGCERIYPDIFAVGRAALYSLHRTLETGYTAPNGGAVPRYGSDGCAMPLAMCVSARPVVSRLVAQWRFRDCRDGLYIRAGDEEGAVSTLPLRALYLHDAALERLTRIGLRQFGDVARLSRGALDSLVGRACAHIAYNQCRGLDVSPPKITEKPKAIVERIPVGQAGVSSVDGLIPYLEVACNRIAFALYVENGGDGGSKYRSQIVAGGRATGRLDLKLTYVDERKRFAGATLRKPTPFACDLLKVAGELAAQAQTRRVNVSAVELTASRLSVAVLQGNMFDTESRLKQESLELSLNRIRAKFGFDAVRTGRELAGIKV